MRERKCGRDGQREDRGRWIGYGPVSEVNHTQEYRVVCPNSTNIALLTSYFQFLLHPSTGAQAVVDL